MRTPRKITRRTPRKAQARRASPRPLTALYQIKITLLGSKPSIWRRLLVRDNITLDQLHDVIQLAMGWTDSHLHQFITGTKAPFTYYSCIDFDSSEACETLNEKQHTIADLAPAAKRKFIYEYDFGDGWEHVIVVEKILSLDPEFKHSVCLAGAQSCPPEDCGGIFGYDNLLHILHHPKHPEHQTMLEWIGEDWRLRKFSLEDANYMLKLLRY